MVSESLIHCPSRQDRESSMSTVDMRIEIDEYCPTACSPAPPRRSNSLPFMLVDCYYPRRSTSSRSSLLYDKLPKQPLRLSVLKLDGSYFEIEVMKSATVAEVRRAVEEVFSHIPGPAEIPWAHVWGHFCLCYDGQKLLAEMERIRNYGIRDGDQLQFIRHFSINHSPSKKRSIWRIASSEHTKISRPSNNYRREEQRSEEDLCRDDVESQRFWHSDEEEDDNAEHDGSMWSCIVKPGSPCASRLPTREEMKVLKASPPNSASASRLLGRFRKIVRFCCNSRYSRRLE